MDGCRHDGAAGRAGGPAQNGTESSLSLEENRELFERMNNVLLEDRDKPPLQRVDSDGNDSCVALSKIPLWKIFNMAVGAIPAESAEASQENVTREEVQAVQRLYESVVEKMREVYRRAWNMPNIKETLSHCPQLMILGGADVCDTVHSSAFSSLILRASRQVFCEYQRQLWDPEGFEAAAAAATTTTASGGGRGGGKGYPIDSQHFFVPIGSIGIFSLDLWSSRNYAQNRPMPDNALISSAQWTALSDVLQWASTLKTLIVCMDIPFTGRTPAEVHRVSSLRPESWARDEWSSREAEFCRLLSTLLEWKSIEVDREVHIISGSGGVAPAGESLLKRSSMDCLCASLSWDLSQARALVLFQKRKCSLAREASMSECQCIASFTRTTLY